MTFPVVGIYHKDCVDGTAAAAVLLRAFPHAQLFSLSHRYSVEDFTPIRQTLTSDTHIFIVDTTVGIDTFLQEGYIVTVIDHHISEQKHLLSLEKTYDTLTYVFKNDHSGSSLAWSYFFPDVPLPEILMYVEDNDLWHNTYGETTKAVTLYLSLFKNNPQKMLTCIIENSPQTKERGAIIAEYTDATIARLVTIPSLTLQIGTFSIPAFNITDHESACGNILAKKLDQAVALYTIRGDRVKMGFRSLDHHNPSACIYAEMCSGGGHRNAAGADISLKTFFECVRAGEILSLEASSLIHRR